MNFAAHMTAVAGEVAVWQVPRWIDGSILFFLVPLVLICINNLGVRVSPQRYGSLYGTDFC